MTIPEDDIGGSDVSREEAEEAFEAVRSAARSQPSLAQLIQQMTAEAILISNAFEVGRVEDLASRVVGVSTVREAIQALRVRSDRDKLIQDLARHAQTVLAAISTTAGMTSVEVDRELSRSADASGKFAPPLPDDPFGISRDA